MPRRARIDNPTTQSTSPIRWALLAVFSLVVSLPAVARYNDQVQGTEVGDVGPNPWAEDLSNQVGIIEKVNSPLPAGLTFIDEEGKPVTLESFYKTGRPIVINLGYSRCPSICIVMRDQITQNLGETGLTLGEDFVILNISIDPTETPEQARDIRSQVFKQLEEKGIEPSSEGWRFLTADSDTIAKLTDGVGYRYLYIKPQDQYGHPGVLVLADGEGVIRRYLNGTNYTAKTLRLSIVETSDGKVGSLLDKAYITCFVFDPKANNYAATAKFIMMTGGGVTIVVIVGLVLAGFAYEKRKRQLDLTNTCPSA